MKSLYTPSPGHVWKLQDPFKYSDMRPDGKITFYAGNNLDFTIVSDHPMIVYSPVIGPVECFKLKPTERHSLIEFEVSKVYNEFGIVTKLLWVSSRLHGTWQYEW